jgi:hypothetical protein
MEVVMTTKYMACAIANPTGDKHCEMFDDPIEAEVVVVGLSAVVRHFNNELAAEGFISVTITSDAVEVEEDEQPTTPVLNA